MDGLPGTTRSERLSLPFAGLNRRRAQLRIMRAALATRFAFIYGQSDYNRHREAIHRYWNEKLPRTVSRRSSPRLRASSPTDNPADPKYMGAMIPRRHGKTQCHTPLEAVCLYFLPGDRIMLLTIGQVVSSQTMREVRGRDPSLLRPTDRPLLVCRST